MWKRDLSPWYCPEGSAMAEDLFCRRLSPRCHPEGGAVAEDSPVYSSLTCYLENINISRLNRVLIMSYMVQKGLHRF